MNSYRDFCRQALSLSPPAAYRHEQQPADARIGTRLPTFHAAAAEQARATSVPNASGLRALGWRTGAPRCGLLCVTGSGRGGCGARHAEVRADSAEIALL